MHYGVDTHDWVCWDLQPLGVVSCRQPLASRIEKGIVDDALTEAPLAGNNQI